MGQVFLGEDLALGRRVAIKLISERVAADAAVVTRFSREARLLATVEHPHVVRVYSFGRIDDRPYLVMEYVEGESLAEVIRRGPMPVAEALRILREAIDGLQAAQELNIIHRDLKPANILLDRRSRVRVADFGLAKRAAAGEGDSAITQSGYLIGSPHYLSPEQAQGEPTDFRSDIYSLGVVLYEMLTGDRPFAGSTPIAIVSKHLHDPLPPVQAKRPDVPQSVARLISRMTAKKREDRPASYAELLREIESPRPAPETKPWVPMAAAATLVLALGAFWWIQTRPLVIMQRAGAAVPTAQKRITIAITPFYGPDPESDREGRVMAALVERSIASRLGRNEVRLLGIADTKQSVRSHDEARALAGKLGAHVVIWGESLAFRGETELQPYLTVAGLESDQETAAGPGAPALRGMGAPATELSERDAAVVRLPAEAPNQIELRKTSAEGLGQMATFLAGIYALHREKNPAKALRLFEQAPASPDLLRHRAQAHVMLDDRRAAADLLERVVAADAGADEARAQLADLLMVDGRMAEAARHYRALADAGKSIPTRNAVLHDGLLFVRETFSSQRLTDGKPRETGVVLVIDPARDVVVKRYAMPGLIKRFVPAGDRLTIECKSRESGEAAHESRVEYAAGRFTRPLIRSGNLLSRMNAMRAGWKISANFIHEVVRLPTDVPPEPKFRPAAKPEDADAPKTFAELETALRAAFARDPTQPWHLFFLGQTLQATGRPAEAREVWRQMLAREFDGIHYNEWAWMSAFFTRLRQFEWAEAAAVRAEVLRRRDPQPITHSTLIECLINVRWVRTHPRQQFDDARRLDLLRRARRVSGRTEADHLAAAAWRAELSRRGDARGAQQEADWYRRSVREPFNLTVRAVYLDYALYLLLASAFTFVTLLALAFDRAMPDRARAEGVRKRLAGVWNQAVASRYRIVFATASLAFVLFIVAGVALAIEAQKAAPLYLAAGVVALLIAVTAPRRAGTTWLDAIRRISWRERVVVMILALAVLVASMIASREVAIIGAVASAPIGLADSFGHIDVVRALEASRSKADTPEVRYALAVANHLAGELQQAERLYRSLPGDARTARALAHVARGERRVEMPASNELLRALREPPVFVSPREVGQLAYDVNVPSGRLLATVVGFVLAVAALTVLLFATIRPSGSQPPPSHGSRGRAIREALFPGARDCRLDRPLLAAAQIFALWLAVMVGFWSSLGAQLGAPGLVSRFVMPQIFTAFPFPNAGWDRWTMIFAHPYANVFWTIVAIGTISLVILHVRTVIAIWRQKQPLPDSSAAALRAETG